MFTTTNQDFAAAVLAMLSHTIVAASSKISNTKTLADRQSQIKDILKQAFSKQATRSARRPVTLPPTRLVLGSPIFSMAHF